MTILANMLMVHRALAAAEQLAGRGIEAEVIDVRCLVPLDMETIARSVGKTHRVLIVEEDNLTGGWGAEIAAEISEKLFDELDVPVTAPGGFRHAAPLRPGPRTRIHPQRRSDRPRLPATGRRQSLIAGRPNWNPGFRSHALSTLRRAPVGICGPMGRGGGVLGALGQRQSRSEGAGYHPDCCKKLALRTTLPNLAICRTAVP